jgi:hypothetical protein
LPCASGFSTVYAMASFLPDLFSWPHADSFSLCLDFSSILLLITGKTPLPIFSCATERLVPRRPRDSISSYLPSRFVAPPDFVFVEQSRSLCGKEKHPGNKPRRPHRRSYFTASSLVAHAWKTLALSPRRQSSDFGLLLLIFL